MGLSFQAPSAAEEEVGVRGLYGAELDIFDDYLDWEPFNKGPITDKDLKLVLNRKLKVEKIWIRMHKRKQRGKLKREVNSLRYLRRSSNQLIRTIKALRGR